MLDRALVQIQCPLALGDEHEPEPDVALVPPGDYLEDHPDHTLLVIEVAGSSLRKDRLIKPGMYAAASISEYWIVNLQDRLIEVHTEPATDHYRRITPHGPDDKLSLVELPDITINTSDVLPQQAFPRLGGAAVTVGEKEVCRIPTHTVRSMLFDIGSSTVGAVDGPMDMHGRGKISTTLGQGLVVLAGFSVKSASLAVPGLSGHPEFAVLPDIPVKSTLPWDKVRRFWPVRRCERQDVAVLPDPGHCLADLGKACSGGHKTVDF